MIWSVYFLGLLSRIRTLGPYSAVVVFEIINPAWSINISFRDGTNISTSITILQYLVTCMFVKIILIHAKTQKKNNLCGMSVPPLLNVMVDLAEPPSGICLNVENNQ